MERSVEVAIIIFIVFILHYLIYFWLTRKKKSVQGKHVCVTGGSSGIGLWMAIYAARAGADVTIVARKVNLLEKAVKVIRENCLNENQKIEYHSLDVTKSSEEIHKSFEKIEEKSGEIYMLVNCAGMAICGTIEKTTPADSKFLMDLNFYGTLFPIQYVLPKMKARKDGIIVLTASQAALLGIFGLGVYSASKFALRGLAETLYMETKHLGINVCLALPADTDTPGFANEQKSKPKETQEICGGGGLFKPEVVAKSIFNDALSGSFFSVKGLESWFLSILCVGMSPWKNPILGLLQFYTMGPFRMLGMLVQWNFGRIVRKFHHDHEHQE